MENIKKYNMLIEKCKKIYEKASVRVFHCKKTLDICTESSFSIFKKFNWKLLLFTINLPYLLSPGITLLTVTWTKSLLSKILSKLLFNSWHTIISPKIYSQATNKKFLQGYRFSPTIISWYSVKENGIQTSMGHWGMWGAAEDYSCLFKLGHKAPLYWAACAAQCSGQRGAR